MSTTEAQSTPTTAPTRTVAGLEVPVPGTYQIDPSHSEVGFVAKHLMVAKTRGRFSSFSGAVVIGEDPADSSVEVSIDTTSVDTRDDQRDGHLKSADFFDAETFPTMTFRSTDVTHESGNRWSVEGELTIKGVSKPVVLHVVFEGGVIDPWGGTRSAFSATTELDREAWGLSWNQALETGGVLVGKKVKIEIEAEAVRQD